MSLRHSTIENLVGVRLSPRVPVGMSAPIHRAEA